MKNIYVESIYNRDVHIGFYADKKILLNNYELYEKFIKGCEHVVRTDKRYSEYIAQIKNSGVVKCAVFGNLKENDKIKMEAHHGPIFTLFDICDITLRYLFEKDKQDITEFMVADLVLTEHESNNIQIVMLSKGVHKGKHNRLKKKEIFLQMTSSIGKIERFIDNYELGMQPEHYEMVDRYLYLCKKYKETADHGLFDTGKTLLSFKNRRD